MRRQAAVLGAAAALLLLGLAPGPARGFLPPGPWAPADAASAGTVRGEPPSRRRGEAASTGDHWAAGAGLRAAALAFAIGVAASVSVARAADGAAPPSIQNGSSVFAMNCAACHAGGNNAVQSDKKLKKEALVKYGMYDAGMITYQVTNGKNAMPAFGERLGGTEIVDVAAYVLSQADKGWP